jgi:hypothetical protein
VTTKHYNAHNVAGAQPSEAAIADRDRRLQARSERDARAAAGCSEAFTQWVCGDPPKGQSALCKRQAAAVPKAPSLWQPSERAMFVMNDDPPPSNMNGHDHGAVDAGPNDRTPNIVDT